MRDITIDRFFCEYQLGIQSYYLDKNYLTLNTRALSCDQGAKLRNLHRGALAHEQNACD